MNRIDVVIETYPSETAKSRVAQQKVESETGAEWKKKGGEQTQSVRPWKTECQKQRYQQQRRPEGYSRKKCGRRAKRKRDERNDQCAPFRVPTTPAEEKRRHRPAERPDNRFVIDREVSE